MPGRRLPRSTRVKLRAGQKVVVRRGFRRDDLPARPASPCVRIDPVTGEVVGEFLPHAFTPAAAQLKISPRAPWLPKRHV
jgi:hypothetical protein